jgi:NADPH-dependent dioxygenase
MPTADVDALIVGAGPVGLVMAHELARHGVRCRIIDKNPLASEHSKALAIQARTLETLQMMGIAGRFLEEGHRVQRGEIRIDGRAAVSVNI